MEMTRNSENWLETVYSAKNQNELEKGYDQWAEAYDRDLLRFGYRLPPLAAGLLSRYVQDRSAPLLEAGCGTGLLGEILVALNFEHIEGFDLSERMLAVAKRKRAYKALYKMRLGDRLSFTDHQFVAVVSIGTFTVGHAGPEGFDELIRITQPGGYLVISIRTDINPDNPHLHRMNEIEAEGRWRCIDQSHEVVTMPWEDANLRNKIYVFQRAARAA